jgi:hypothetical protein
MSTLDAERLAGFEHQLDLDLDRISSLRSVADRRIYTYLVAYPDFLSYFATLHTIDARAVVIGSALAYSLMPTAINLRENDISSLLDPLNTLKQEGRRLPNDRLLQLKSLVNNSIVGTSKLLHFIRPDVYPIWDSRIDRFIHGDGLDTNSLDRYVKYLNHFDRIAPEPVFAAVRQSLGEKLGYAVTGARAFEMVMYLADVLGLEFKPPPESTTPAVIPEGRARPPVPVYKRDAFTFVSNLGPVTADRGNPDTLIRDGYLLSERYTTNANLQLAAWARSRRKLLISDNGNWTRMSSLARPFEPRGSEILRKANLEVDATGEVTPATRAERDALIAEVAQACSSAVAELNFSQIIETQLRMTPVYMIGLEDFTIPVITMLGLMGPVFSPDAREVAEFQRRTATLFTRQIEGEFGFLRELSRVAMLLVVHAYDYNSALAGAQAARVIPKDGLAISYGAPMSSRRWITELAIGEVVEDLGESLPESYLAAHALTIGVANGHGDDTPIHILGVGTPILIMMIGFLLKHSRAVSIDSSAPMKDAFDGRIYGSRQAYLKMRMYRVAAIALIDDNPYESTTPFFRAFEARHPSDWPKLRRELGVTAATNPGELERTLESSQDLVRRHIPFFTRLTSSNDPFFWDLRVSRAGHNYCVLREIVDHVRRRKNNWPALKAWTEREIARYVATADPKWARAVQKSFELTVKHRLIPQ